MGIVTAGSDPRISRVLLLAVCVVLFLNFLYMLRDWHEGWDIIPSEGSGVRLAAPSASATQVESTRPPTTMQMASIPEDEIIPFPRKLWQTSKHSTSTLDDDSKSHISTWTKLNSDWRYEILTDSSAETYVRTTFAHKPAYVSTYLGLHDPILRADMLRYLVLLGDGGVYSDMDTRALKPIDDWIPAQYRGRAHAVVGIEYDRMDNGRWSDWTLDLQITNWAMLSQPWHPVYEYTLDKLVNNVRSLAGKKGQRISELKPANDEVLDTTGPAMFTLAIFQLLSERTGYEFSWLNCTRLKEPLLVSDVLILPVTSFASNQVHSESGQPNDELALVQHMFRGSWKGINAGRTRLASDEKKAKEEEEKKKKEEEDKKKKEEEEKKKQEEEQKKQEEEKKKKEEEQKKQDKERKELEGAAVKQQQEQQNTKLDKVESQTKKAENQREEELIRAQP